LRIAMQPPCCALSTTHQLLQRVLGSGVLQSGGLQQLCAHSRVERCARRVVAQPQLELQRRARHVDAQRARGRLVLWRGGRVAQRRCERTVAARRAIGQRRRRRGCFRRRRGCSSLRRSLALAVSCKRLFELCVLSRSRSRIASERWQLMHAATCACLLLPDVARLL
jgi:hypothetical protein